MAKTYTLHVAGLTRELPICKINDHLDIAAFIMFSDVELTIACAKALLEKCPDFDVILTAEAKGIPLAYEMSRQSGKQWIPARKGVKGYMTDPVIVEDQSITTAGKQTLVIDKKDLDYMNGKRILVVDDVEMNLKVVKGLLKETGMQIDTAISGRECLECIKENQYDIIFLDHMMPEMDGVETLQRIKELPDNPNADKPVVMLTANAIIGAREEYLKEGFTDYLSKPIREKELDRTIKKYLPPERLTVREKEEPEEVSESMTEKKEESKTLMQRLEELPELDTETGIHYCADNKEFYQEIVQEYANTDKTRDMKELYQSKDWDEYRIMVHALKSSSLTIGAVGLSEAAKALEMAAKEKDLEYIEQHHEEVLGRYTALLEVLQDIYQKA